MIQKFFNNADTATLSASIGIGATSFTLQTGEGDDVFPIVGDGSDYFYATIGAEVVRVYERTDDTFTCDATETAWSSGTTVVQYTTAEMMGDMAQRDGSDSYLDNHVLRSCKEAVATYSSITSNTLTLDLEYHYHVVTLTQNVTTLAFQNVPDGGVGSYVVEFIQDSTGGRTITWPSSVKTPNDVAITIGTAANAVSVVMLMTRDQGTTYLAGVFGVNFA